MSLFGMMRTSVSGMQAQANRLSAVSDNIANADTTGYKRYDTQFSVLVNPAVESSTSTEIGSGGVLTELRQSISQQGTLSYTSSVTDLAIDGQGFFIVENEKGTPYMTRSGAFVPDGEGFLVNSAGMKLSGYSLENGPVSVVSNGFAGLEAVSVVESDLDSDPTTFGTFEANMPSTTAVNVSAANLPSANAPSAKFDEKTSLVVYDHLGEERLIDLYFTKTSASTWEVALYDQSLAHVATGFPYSAGPLSVDTLEFDLTTGELTGGSTSEISFTTPNGESVTIDMSDMTQLAADYQVFNSTVNGHAPSPIQSIDIDEDGILYARYSDGSFRGLYRIPLATVISPDRLTGETGSIFVQGTDSGSVQIGFPTEGKLGSIRASSLEQSNVDLAQELTTMIQSQRGYTANSKVFQTGSDLMDVLVNLKR